MGKQEALIPLLPHYSHKRRSTMKPKELIAEAISLPVEERAIVVDSILRSLNSPEDDIDRQWIAEAERRLDEVRTGRVKAIPGDQVFAQIRKRFAG